MRGGVSRHAEAAEAAALATAQWEAAAALQCVSRLTALTGLMSQLPGGVVSRRAGNCGGSFVVCSQAGSSSCCGSCCGGAGDAAALAADCGGSSAACQHARSSGIAEAAAAAAMAARHRRASN